MTRSERCLASEMSALSHATADKIIREEWQKVYGRLPTENEVMFTQAVAWLETNYGRAGQHGKLAEQGHYNWANIEKHRTGETCEPGWMPGKDQGDVCFRVFDTDNEAANALITTLTKRHWPVLQAMADPATPEAIAQAMKVKPAYYAADEALYAKAIANSLRAMGKTPQPPSAASQAVAATTKSAGGLVILGATATAIGALYWYAKRR